MPDRLEEGNEEPMIAVVAQNVDIMDVVKMTFRRLTELQEQSWSATHTSAIMHWVETNARNQTDRGQRGIVAGDG